MNLLWLLGITTTILLHSKCQTQAYELGQYADPLKMQFTNPKPGQVFTEGDPIAIQWKGEAVDNYADNQLERIYVRVVFGNRGAGQPVIQYEARVTGGTFVSEFFQVGTDENWLLSKRSEEFHVEIYGYKKGTDNLTGLRVGVFTMKSWQDPDEEPDPEPEPDPTPEPDPEPDPEPVPVNPPSEGEGQTPTATTRRSSTTTKRSTSPSTPKSTSGGNDAKEDEEEPIEEEDEDETNDKDSGTKTTSASPSGTKSKETSKPNTTSGGKTSRPEASLTTKNSSTKPMLTASSTGKGKNTSTTSGVRRPRQTGDANREGDEDEEIIDADGDGEPDPGTLSPDRSESRGRGGSTEDSNDEEDGNSSGGLSPGVKAGIAIGVIVPVLIILIVVFIIYRRGREKQQEMSKYLTEMEGNPQAGTAMGTFLAPGQNGQVAEFEGPLGNNVYWGRENAVEIGCSVERREMDDGSRRPEMDGRDADHRFPPAENHSLAQPEMAQVLASIAENSAKLKNEELEGFENGPPPAPTRT